MKKVFLSILLFIITQIVFSQISSVSSPDGMLKLDIFLEEGHPYYSVIYDGKTILEKSPLGIITNEGDFSKDLIYKKHNTERFDKKYTQDRIKKSDIHYIANRLDVAFEDVKQREIKIVFQVSDNDIAFRYELPHWGERRAVVVEKEATGFKFPEYTTTFLSPMMGAMGAFARTSPSYESGYTNDEPVGRGTHGKLEIGRASCRERV